MQKCEVLSVTAAVVICLAAIWAAYRLEALSASLDRLESRAAALAPQAGQESGVPAGQSDGISTANAARIQAELKNLGVEFAAVREHEDRLVPISTAGALAPLPGESLTDVAERFYLLFYEKKAAAEALRQIERQDRLFTGNVDSAWGDALKLSAEQSEAWKEVIRSQLKTLEPYLANRFKPDNLDAWIGQVNEDLNRRLKATLTPEQEGEYDKMKPKPNFTNLLYRAGKR
ncbi:MAG: hypothetical protein HYY18_00355 [Planctomycetes bacterium]|nr:hypothetical protein [Planctomycetota bacterium]